MRERKAAKINGEEHSKQREQQIRLWGVKNNKGASVAKAEWVRGRLRPDIIRLQKPSKDFGIDSDECDRKLLEHLPMSDMIWLIFSQAYTSCCMENRMKRGKG